MAEISRLDLAKVFAVTAAVCLVCVPLISKMADVNQAMDGCKPVRGEEVQQAMSAVTPFLFMVTKEDGCRGGYAKPAVK